MLIDETRVDLSTKEIGKILNIIGDFILLKENKNIPLNSEFGYCYQPENKSNTNGYISMKINKDDVDKIIGFNIGLRIPLNENLS